jgi:hypothetical protein
MPAFNESMLPPRPNLIPDELRQFTADNTMFVAAVARWLSDPRFGVRVHVDVRDDGWLLDIGLPRPVTRDDVTLPD